MPVPTPHIGAQAGEIADTVLLPGDPLRAQVIADTFLDDVVCYSRVRNMLGFTGTYKGRSVSVQGTGMGMPSISIYATELMRFYGVTTAIRVGSCGALQTKVKLRDIIIATAAHTDSNMNNRRFGGLNFAATADFKLVGIASRLAETSGLRAHVGTIFSSDAFYGDTSNSIDVLTRHGTLAVEMEGAGLYTVAAGEGARALCIATVSDHLVTHEVASSEERQNEYMAMAELALRTVLEAG
jgi:purine-nucleoside phosphorylase